MRPEPRSRIAGTAARVQRNAPVALTSSWACQLSSVVRCSGALSEIPAPLTSTSTAPSRSNSAPTAASSVTSHAARPTATTRSPSARKPSAIAWPMPLVPPVTTTSRLTERKSTFHPADMSGMFQGPPVERRLHGMNPSPYWNPRTETLERPALEALQLRKLRDLLERTVARAPWQAQRLRDAGVTADSIRSLDDLRRIPFLERADWMETQIDDPPFGAVFFFQAEDGIRDHCVTGSSDVCSSDLTCSPRCSGASRSARWTPPARPRRRS